MQLLLQNNQCALAAPPGNDQEFLFFLCRSKRGRLLRANENDEGVAAQAVDACGGSIVN